MRAGRTLTIGVAVACSMLAATPAASAEEQPQVGFLSGEFYVEDGMAYYMANADGTDLIDLSQGSALTSSWSPDGTRIAFTSRRDGTLRLYVADVGAAPEAIAEAGAGPSPRWSPDGTRIAYISVYDRLEVIDVDTRAVLPVATGVATSDGSTLAWSPDARHLVFQSGSALYMADTTGAWETSLLTTRYTGGAAWSPEGDRLLYVSDEAGNDNIYLVELFGTGEPKQLTTGTGDDVEPAWSGDGSRIAYTSGFEIMVLDADGSNAVSATGGPIDLDPADHALSTSLGGPVWAPSGGSIAAIGTILPPAPSSGHFIAFLVDPEGVQEPVEVNTGRGWGSPRWSRSGTRLMISAASVYGPTTAILDASGALLFGFGGSGATWSPDETRIAYGVGHAAPTGVWVMDADGSDAHQIGESLGHPNGFSPSWRPEPVDPVGLVDPATGRWYLHDGAGWIRSFYYGNPGDVPFLGDWDCDGIDTPGLYRQSDGYAYLRNTNSQGVADIAFYFGNPGDIPLAGDFDGDGCDTLSIYRPSEQRFYIIDHLGSADRGLGAAAFSFVFGNPGDQPVVGDWDGDGIDEIGLHRQTTGYFYWRNTLTTGTGDGNIFFGDPGDHFIAGDWIDHDGTDAPAVYRPAATTFFYRATLTQGTADDQLAFGRATWIPVAGTTD